MILEFEGVIIYNFGYNVWVLLLIKLWLKLLSDLELKLKIFESVI